MIRGRESHYNEVVPGGVHPAPNRWRAATNENKTADSPPGLFDGAVGVHQFGRADRGARGPRLRARSRRGGRSRRSVPVSRFRDLSRCRARCTSRGALAPVCARGARRSVWRCRSRNGGRFRARALVLAGVEVRLRVPTASPPIEQERPGKGFTEPVALSSTASIDVPPSGLAAFRVQPLETTSTYSRSVLGARGNLAISAMEQQSPVATTAARSGKPVGGYALTGHDRRPKPATIPGSSSQASQRALAQPPAIPLGGSCGDNRCEAIRLERIAVSSRGRGLRRLHRRSDLGR